jgi:hypothetical protein
MATKNGEQNYLGLSSMAKQTRLSIEIVIYMFSKTTSENRNFLWSSAMTRCAKISQHFLRGKLAITPKTSSPQKIATSSGAALDYKAPDCEAIVCLRWHTTACLVFSAFDGTRHLNPNLCLLHRLLHLHRSHLSKTTLAILAGILSTAARDSGNAMNM